MIHRKWLYARGGRRKRAGASVVTYRGGFVSNWQRGGGRTFCQVSWRLGRRSARSWTALQWKCSFCPACTSPPGSSVSGCEWKKQWWSIGSMREKKRYHFSRTTRCWQTSGMYVYTKSSGFIRALILPHILRRVEFYLKFCSTHLWRPDSLLTHGKSTNQDVPRS